MSAVEERVAHAAPAAEGLTEADRQLLRDSVRDFLASRWPVEGAPERSLDPQALAAVWREMAAQGLTALGADPAQGGLREILLVAEELGRASCPVPFAGAVAANLALASQRGASPAAEALLAGIAEGSARVALGLGTFDGDSAAGSVAFEGGKLNGSIAFVEGTAGATHLLVFSETPPAAVIVAADASGMRVTQTPGLAVPALAEVSFDATPAGCVETDRAVLADIALAMRLVAAARALGAAQRVFDLAVEHAKVRRQFGQLIGSFQAIQHKLANCMISLDGTRLLLEQAAESYALGSADRTFFANAALAFGGPSLREVAVQSHRALGAIGYAEEHEAPRHFRRIHADTVRFGGVARARAALADWVLRPAAAREGALPAHSTDPAVEAFRKKVRAWLRKNWNEERRAAHRARPFRERGWDREFSRLMGQAGWIGVGWPKDFGGQGRTPSEQIAFLEEIARAEAPIQAHSTGESIVAHALMKYGTKEQQEEWLPAIRRGERSFALGYSEPEAGSDLAALRTRAVRDGDYWVVNGQKLWSTGGDKAEYVWLAVRTDPEAKKHAGISVLMVDLKSPGVTIRPSLAMYGKTFSAVFYDNVRVPAKNLVGEVNGGWKVITDALASERVMIGASRMAALERAFGRLAGHVRTAKVNGRPLKKDALVRDRIGALAAELEVARQFQMRNTRMVEQGRVPLYEAAMGKVFASELQERLGQAALDILGSAGLLGEESPSAPLPEMEQVLRHSIMGMIGGGTSEIQRNVIAIRGLGLPR